MQRLKLTLAYDGSHYAGWQLQAESQRKSTVQKEVEAALAALLGEPVRLHGAGRTDSGVHAEAQVAHVDVPRGGLNWRQALNTKLPRDIRIVEVEEVSSDFHARFSATGKLYAYSLHVGSRPVSPRILPYVWSVPNLDRSRMEEAAALLCGEHDFAAWQNVGTPVTDTVRTLWSIRRVENAAGPLSCPEAWRIESWYFHGNGFLKQMVRNLMGCLVWVGQGKVSLSDVAAALEGSCRCALSSPTAPAKGLSLMRVDYSSLAFSVGQERA